MSAEENRSASNLFRPHYTINILFMGFILGEFLSFTNCQYRVDAEYEAWKKLTSNTKSMEKCYKLCYKNVLHPIHTSRNPPCRRDRSRPGYTAGRELFSGLQNCCRMYCKTIKICTQQND